MKKKVLIFFVLGISLCGIICGCSEVRFLKRFERSYNISLPEKAELVYKYSSGFEDKTEYYVVTVTDSNYTLNVNSRYGEEYEKAKENGLDVSEWENLDFNSLVLSTLEKNKGIDKDYYPDLNADYEWIYRSEDFFVLYYPSESRLIIYSFTH